MQYFANLAIRSKVLSGFIAMTVAIAGLSHMTEQLEHERVVPSGALELGRQ